MPKPKKKPRTDAADRVARAVARSLMSKQWSHYTDHCGEPFSAWEHEGLASYFFIPIRRAMRPRRSKR